MYSKLSISKALLTVGTLALAGNTAIADRINTSGVLCHNYNAAEALDIDYIMVGVRNINASPRDVICSIPRSPLIVSTNAVFIVDGANFGNTSTHCTISTFLPLVSAPQQLSFTESATGTTRFWSHTVTFPTNGIGAADYASMHCTLPGGAGGEIFGITSLQ